MTRDLSPTLGRRGPGRWDGEAPETQAGAAECGPHVAPRGTEGETEEQQQHKSYVWKGPINEFAISCVSRRAIKRISSSFSVKPLQALHPRYSLKIKLSPPCSRPIFIYCVLVWPPLGSEWACPEPPARFSRLPHIHSELKKPGLTEKRIASLYFRSGNHISSQSEIKKFACHLLISFLSVKQPSKTCFPPLERSK